MTTEFQRGPAKIYQFPTRVRPALGGYREDARPGENPAITTASAAPAQRVAVVTPRVVVGKADAVGKAAAYLADDR